MPADNRHAFRIRPGMRRGFRSEVPLPTRLVSNEEFPPLPQTAAQRAVEDRILADAGRLAPRLGLSRRRLPPDERRHGDVAPRDERGVRPVLRRAARSRPRSPPRSRSGRASRFFIFDVQLHYVGAGYDPDQCGGRRARA